MDDDVLEQLGDIERWLKACDEPVLLIDGGGVLFNNVIEDSAFIEQVAHAFHVDPSKLLAAYTAEDAAFETNRISVHRVLDGCLQRLGCSKPNAAAFMEIDALYTASIVPNPSMFEALEMIRAQGITLVLANNEAEHWDRLKHTAFGYFDLFDHIASSWKLGACKPTPEYFERLDRLLRPIPRSRWRLLDDNPRVVATARALGVAASRYGAGIPIGMR